MTLHHLLQSDIFSLGATMYEICLGLSPTTPNKTLPQDGQEWQDIRHGKLLQMPSTSFDMAMIIRQMMLPEWRNRPSAEELLKKPQLLSDEERKIRGLEKKNKALEQMVRSSLRCLPSLTWLWMNLTASHICIYMVIPLFPIRRIIYNTKQQRFNAMSPRKGKKFARSNTIC